MWNSLPYKFPKHLVPYRCQLWRSFDSRVIRWARGDIPAVSDHSHPAISLWFLWSRNFITFGVSKRSFRKPPLKLQLFERNHGLWLNRSEIFSSRDTALGAHDPWIWNEGKLLFYPFQESKPFPNSFQTCISQKLSFSYFFFSLPLWRQDLFWRRRGQKGGERMNIVHDPAEVDRLGRKQRTDKLLHIPTVWNTKKRFLGTWGKALGPKPFLLLVFPLLLSGDLSRARPNKEPSNSSRVGEGGRRFCCLSATHWHSSSWINP